MVYLISALLGVLIGLICFSCSLHHSCDKCIRDLEKLENLFKRGKK